MNRDSLPDLVIATAAGIGIFTNLGTDFAPGDSFPLADARSLALADIDGDSDIDIVAGGRGTLVGVWRNTGSGTFPMAPDDTLPLNAWTEALALRDIDADGFPELFVGMFGGANQLFHNDGGTFAAPAAAPGGLWTNGLALADVDHDGDLDLLTHSKEDTGTPAPSTND